VPYDKLLLQGVPIESHPSKLVGSNGSHNRYFDFDKLGEVCSDPTVDSHLLPFNEGSNMMLFLPGYVNCYIQSEQNN
jgi:hypothetical protein